MKFFILSTISFLWSIRTWTKMGEWMPTSAYTATLLTMLLLFSTKTVEKTSCVLFSTMPVLSTICWVVFEVVTRAGWQREVQYFGKPVMVGRLKIL